MTNPKITSLVKENGYLKINLPGPESHDFSRTSWVSHFAQIMEVRMIEKERSFYLIIQESPQPPFSLPMTKQLALSSLDICSIYRLTCPRFLFLILRRLSLKRFMSFKEVIWDTEPCGMTAKTRLWAWLCHYLWYDIAPLCSLYHLAAACPNFIKSQTSRVGKILNNYLAPSLAFYSQGK